MARQDTERRLAASLAAVRTRIFAAAARAGRDPTSVRLVAVTKGQPPDVVRAAYHAGQRDFGENRVEEALPKQAALADLDGVQWHMIGHIQSRKARLVPPAFTLVHSLDRPKIAGLLDRYAGESGRRLRVLLECNVSGEATKEGWQLADRTQWADRRAEIADVLALGSLKVMGLMTMAPLTQDPGVMRAVFRTLRQLRDDLADNLPGTWSELSMGMTDDFEVAIEEGATLVRIGRAIFGPRSG